MKKLLLGAVLALLGLSGSVFGQENNYLYIGFRSNTTIDIVDTSGGAFTTVGNLFLTNDIASGVSATHGLSINPADQQMYILYQDAGGNTNRRLGVLDTLSGLITDIAGVGNMTDIAFDGSGTCYGNSGSPDGYNLYEIDITDGTTTLLGGFSNTTLSTGICYDPFGERLLRSQQQFSGAYWEVDLTTYGETNLGFPSHPGWINSLAMVSETEFLAGGGSGLYEVDLTGMSSISTGWFGSGTIHAMSFGASGLSVIVDGPTVFCGNEASTLFLSDTGSTFQWYVDGASIPDATDSSWVPVVSGVYECVVNGLDTAVSKEITVLPVPEAGFDATPNPLDLGVTPSGAVTFMNTSTGGTDYFWDFDNGFTTSLVSPTMSFLALGDYDITLIVVDEETGCSDTAHTVLSVINTTGLDELQSEFIIFPVPAEDVVNLTMTNGTAAYQLELRDLQGRIVKSSMISTESSTVSFDLTDYDAGMYIIKIFNEDEEGYFKVLKK